MPVQKAAYKALRQSVTRAARNTKVHSDIDALVRRIRKSVEAKDAAKAKDWLGQVIKKIDKATQNGVLKKNTAARKKSRLSKLVSGLK